MAKTKKTVAKNMQKSNSLRKEAVRVPLRPLGDRIVVRPLTPEEIGTRSPSGIIIPDTVSKEKPEQGIVVAVGPGKIDDGDRIPMDISVGDKVLFSKYGYEEVKVGGAEYFIVSENSVLAVINE